MDARASQDPPSSPDADAMLESLRRHPEWTEGQRDAVLDRLVERFPADELIRAVQGRVQDLNGGDAEALLRLVEANPHPDLLSALAESIAAQPDLPPERAWEALAVLEAAGALAAYPALVDLWDELNEALDEDGSIEQLVEQIESDPEGLWLALQGLGAVEPEVRPEIVGGLARGPLGPGLIEFLRLLAYAHDPATRAVALDALAADGRRGEPGVNLAWLDLARHHPDRQVVEAARRRAGSTLEVVDSSASRGLLKDRAPKLERSLVSAVDGRGRATIALSAARGRERVTAVFQCDVGTGVPEVFGDVAPDSSDPRASLVEIAERLDRDVLEEEHPHPLALGLLAGCLTLCGPATSPALRFWIEATAGPDLRPFPFRAEFPDWDPAILSFDEMPIRARAVLDACPAWLDASPLTYELAEEIKLREGDSPPDPRRDAGVYRFLFEHRLHGQLERYRRMLLWMAWFWKADGDLDLARSAMGLAWQLSDAQHVVPGHPFTVALTTRSLAAAQSQLNGGVDPRRTKRR
jgi:hypothetical protein